MDFGDDDSPQMVRIAKTADFTPGQWRGFRILARPVGIVLEPGGRFRAMEVGCKHENANLLEGAIRDGVVTCPWHGWRYDLRTGECVWGSKLCLRPYALEVRGEDLYISLRPVSV